jgi:UDP-N-acetylmuramoylalanine-D-glutamate ligase
MESLPGSVDVPSWQKAIAWESAGAFKVRWLVICTTRFQKVGHLKNALNENQAVLIGKDGQEIEEACGRALVEIIDEEVEAALGG